MGAANLETRLAELVLDQLAPCDLGDGIEVVHDVEAIDVEMECDVSDDTGGPPPLDACDDVGTHELVRVTAPYERIEIQLDANAFLRATIEEAQAVSAVRRRPKEW